MTTPRLPDPILNAWLEEGPNELPDQTRRAIAVSVRTTNQRRRGAFAPWRDTNVNGMTRLVVAMIAAVIGVGGGLYLLANRAPGPSGVVGGQPSTSAAPGSETASTAAGSPRELPRDNVELTAGSYSLAEFPVRISFEIPPFEPPATWEVCSASAVEQAVCHASDGILRVAAGVGLGFTIVDNVVVDPCSDQRTAELRDPPVGPSVDDLVTAISGLDGFTATDPVDITVSGFDGKEFALTAGGCGATWTTADRTTGMGPGEMNLLRVLDVDGTRVLISGVYNPQTSEAERAALERAMNSVQIDK